MKEDPGQGGRANCTKCLVVNTKEIQIFIIHNFWLLGQESFLRLVIGGDA